MSILSDTELSKHWHMWVDEPREYVTAHDMMQAIAEAAYRETLKVVKQLFLGYLTVDSETQDRRRRDFNQAIFGGKEGHAIFNGTDLGMVMEKFDKALSKFEVSNER